MLSTSTLLAVLLAQTVATPDQATGALNTMQSAILAARAGTRQITAPGSGKRACIRPADNQLPLGTVTVRLGVALLDSSFQEFLGLPVPGHVPTTVIDPVYDGTWVNPETGEVEPHQVGTVARTLTPKERWDRTGEQYAAFEVQAVPTTGATFDRALWAGNMDVIEQEMFTVGSASWPICEVAMFRVDDVSIGDFVRCACWDGKRACTYQRLNMDGSTTPVACPRALTMRPGSFSGVGAIAKPCYARFDGVDIDRTWPADCPK